LPSFISDPLSSIPCKNIEIFKLILPNFSFLPSIALALAQLLRDARGGVRGIATSDQGVGKDGAPKATFARGMELIARQTLLAEGCRGSLSEQAMEAFALRKDCDPQTYALGLKEVWMIYIYMIYVFVLALRLQLCLSHTVRDFSISKYRFEFPRGEYSVAV
jgi:hypothetical protein